MSPPRPTLGGAMRDFPPLVTTFWSPEGDRGGDAPDTRSPGRFLRWVLRQQAGLVAVGVGFGVLWQLPLIVGPWVFGRAIDAGIVGADPDRRGRRRRRAAAGDPDRRGLRHLAAHPGGPQLADQPLRHHQDGDPQGRADGARAAAPLPHRRDPQRRLQRLRRVRRDDRDHRPRRLAAGLLPRGGRDRDGDLAAARRDRAARRAGPGGRRAAVPRARSTAARSSSAPATPS